jgi:hypothetical protein
VTIPALRLANQGISAPRRESVVELIGRLGAVQAQEYPFAKWGLALRLSGRVGDADIERDFAAGRILRTHVLRPTWHFVTAEDIVWMLELTAPRIHVAMRAYMQHQGLGGRLMTRATSIFARALAGGRFLTRAELGARLARAGIQATALQLGFITGYAELERVICSGPRRGKDFTYALLAERAPAALRLSRDEALATLTRRFFASHGPATIRDYVWWSGLRVADARRGLDLAGIGSSERDGQTYWGGDRARLRTPPAEGVHLLPIYDEYLVAYRDRIAVPHGPGKIRVGSTTVNFRHSLVIDGQVAGTWTTSRDRTGERLRVTPLRPLSGREQAQLERVADRYARFTGRPLALSI